ncbi:UDP-galactose-4-epimerase [Aneurinibacillus migulanus]|uniref:UDP-glucose 4-epimerase GalE n=1 Tax=Aneurinibacillus migulanus TaxID=47500 RepID=UPI0005BD5853|nr:UDP-glucose 4-epimerase GalE [Aneurinibacillus migulanus]KPD05579.1 UDP-galactose-4-epimerase [Aneurinibacillus migulanus]MCP1357018.1 UDP-glucose 4-epimerase GalE [Aneurinibacillus migulanus]MED4730171.1 UDP-glucose 4-epimerase GalE [Aneurinibacillus migulanus]CEH30657.1 UDP-glucose 4-epimerase [Aneurinibacillus migulanus]
MILVVGGAGYIGSHVVKELIRRGNEVVVLDNLTTGHKQAIDKEAIFIKGNLGNKQDVSLIFEKYPVKAVMHFAANSLVSESVVNPLKYYLNNVVATFTLLETMLEYGIKKFIFSSTAATYGIPEQIPITEMTPTKPINPYGQSKLMVEQIVKDCAIAYSLEYTILRYFNAAGADETGTIGENHNPETHLIPIVLQHLQGQRKRISIFGTDYSTYDGTCIRDYIHVTDLAKAHILALDAMLISKGNIHRTYNLGNGQGYSVRDIIRKCEEITGRKANIHYAERRTGDPAILIASSANIERELGWQPSYRLEDIIKTAWNWHKNHPHGYEKGSVRGSYTYES